MAIDLSCQNVLNAEFMSKLIQREFIVVYTLLYFLIIRSIMTIKLTKTSSVRPYVSIEEHRLESLDRQTEVNSLAA